MKIKLWIIGLLLAALVSVWCQWPDSRKLRVTGCNVGQGDAFLISLGFDQILIDTGQKEKGVTECLGRHMPFWDRKIEVMVVTHDDSDHSGGVEEVMSHYQIGKLVIPDSLSQTTKPVWLEKAENEAIEVESILRGNKLIVGRVKWDCLWPMMMEEKDQDLDKNDSSVVLLISYIDFDILFTSDISLLIEDQLLMESEELSRIEVLKVAHHGSVNSTGTKWIESIKPKVAMIGVGKDNRFGHPNREVMERMKNFHIQILRTDEGEYTMVSDGNQYWTEK